MEIMVPGGTSAMPDPALRSTAQSSLSLGSVSLYCADHLFQVIFLSEPHFLPQTLSLLSDGEVTHPVDDLRDSLPSLRHEERPFGSSSNGVYRHEEADARVLIRILRIVNIEPNARPSLADFDIGEEDIAEYVRQVEEGANKEFGGFFTLSTEAPEWKNASNEFALGMIPRFDTVSPGVVCASVMRWAHGISWTSTRRSSVVILNDVNDTLSLSFETSSRGRPYNLPWTVRYAGEEFQTFNAALARILTQLLPDNDERVSVEPVENPLLLHAVADYLYAEHGRAGEECGPDKVRAR